MPERETFPRQAARVLEHLELLQTQYGDIIESSGDDLRDGIVACAAALRTYLERTGHPPAEPVDAIGA